MLINMSKTKTMVIGKKDRHNNKWKRNRTGKKIEVPM